MHRHELKKFANTLRDSGVSPRHVARAVEEIENHIEDLELEARDGGLTAGDALEFARSHIGDLQDVAQCIAARSELKIWVYRYPRLASVCLPVLYDVLLPTLAIYAGVTRAPVIMRWGASVMLGAVVTAAMFLILQISIFIG